RRRISGIECRERLPADQCFGDRFGFVRPPEGEEAEGAVFVDLPRDVRRGDAIEPPECRERIFVRGRRIQVPGGPQRVLSAERDHQQRFQLTSSTATGHFVRSAATRLGPVAVTSTVCLRSPSCGFRKTSSCEPTVTSRFASGVWPTFVPSIRTSAHGRAFTLI